MKKRTLSSPTNSTPTKKQNVLCGTPEVKKQRKLDGSFKLNKYITVVPETPECQIRTIQATLPVQSSKCLNYKLQDDAEPDTKKIVSLKRKKGTARPNIVKKVPVKEDIIMNSNEAIIHGYELILNLDSNEQKKVEEVLLDQLENNVQENRPGQCVRINSSCMNGDAQSASDENNDGSLLITAGLKSTPSFDDSEFGSDIDDDALNSLMDQATEDRAKLSRYQRLKIELVISQSYTKEVVCQVVDCKNKDRQVTLKLSGEWFFAEVKEGDILHLSTEETGDVVCLSNESPNLLVLHPDILISPTTISSSIRCLRQAVLGEVYRPSVGFSSNEIMLLGTITHSLFDKALSGDDFSVPYLTTSLASIVENSDIVESLSCVQLTQLQVLEKLAPSVKLLSEWGAKFYKGVSNVSFGGQGGEQKIGISQVVDIEENIWSPKYGCKGKVDATVRIHTAQGDRLSPLELKSGTSRNSLGSVDHRAQLILYTMMMEERYQEKVDSGILYYLKGQQTIGVPSSNIERRSLLMKRNEVAAALSVILKDGEVKFPPLINNKMTCKYCNHQQSCTQVYRTFHSSQDDNKDNDSSINHGNNHGNNGNNIGNHDNNNGNHDNYKPQPEIFEQHGAHLSQAHLNYFRKFSKLSVKEAQKSMKEVRMPWKSSRLEGLTLTGVTSSHGYSHTFKLDQTIVPQSCGFSAGQYVLLSRVDGSAYNLAAGFITELLPNSLELCIRDADVRNSPHHSSGPAYKLNKHSSLNFLYTSLGNLSSLLAQTDHSAKLRKLVIELSKPSYTTSLLEFTQEVKVAAQHDPETLLTSLNSDQRQAVQSALGADDYICILGMPGTGKTSTISCLVQLLAGRGQSVLLTAYTHSAVDNLLAKLPGSVDVVRLGAPGRVHPSVKHLTADTLTSHITSPEQLREFYTNKRVVATTCLGMSHSMFEYRRFDYCIVDEASQLTQPICLGPLLMADRAVLVGDHYQLPPLVQSKEAREGGLDVSLFKRLTTVSAVKELAIQYRMNEDIMSLSNLLTYKGRLSCGAENVAQGRLTVDSEGCSSPWMKRCLTSTVLYLNTASLTNAGELREGSMVSNVTEAGLVRDVCQALLKGGVDEADIGVLSPYNQQLKLLASLLPSNIEQLTADRYQGRDKPCIVISFVRSNAEKEVGELLKDPHRLNVALTRAKYKLLMIGDLSTLSTDSMFGRLEGWLREKDWVLDLCDEDLD